VTSCWRDSSIPILAAWSVGLVASNLSRTWAHVRAVVCAKADELRHAEAKNAMLKPNVVFAVDIKITTAHHFNDYAPIHGGRWARPPPRLTHAPPTLLKETSDARRGAGATRGIVSLGAGGADFQPGRSGLRLGFDDGSFHNRWINSLVPQVKWRIVVDLEQLNVRRMVFLQDGPKMFQVALQKVPGAIVQPHGQRLRGAGFADDNIAIVVAIDVERIQFDTRVVVAECKRSGGRATQLEADFVRVFMTRKALSTRSDDIHLAIAVEVAQHPTRDRRRGQAYEHVHFTGIRRPSNCSGREAENQ